MSKVRADSGAGRRALSGFGSGFKRFIGFARRHWLTSFAVLAVIFLLLGPGYTASRPGFYERFEKVGQRHATWSESTHSRVNCQRCHVDPGFVPQSVYALRMTGEIYLSLLPLDREPSVIEAPGNGPCNDCHIDLRTVSPGGDLNIPHKAHVEILKIKCVRCHNELVHVSDPEQNAPKMEMCLECHDGKAARSDCEACHTDKALPDSHRATDWLVVHSQRQNAEDCEKCHGWTDTWCSECHSRRPDSHAPATPVSSWRKRHGGVVETGRNCEACHAAAFCTKCHGEVPPLNFDPALKLVE